MLQKPQKTCDYEHLQTKEWSGWRREWDKVWRNRDGHGRSSYILQQKPRNPERVTAEALLRWRSRQRWLLLPLFQV